MKQSIHIFLKDTRYLRVEICMFFALVAIFARAGTNESYPIRTGAEILLEVAAVYLIARAVHAEPIPGDRQFWLTRPYRRTSLFGAKLLFIAAFVCVPICIAQIAMLMAGGFPLLSSLPGLVWSQIVIFTGGTLVAALATITSGTALFTLSVLPLTAAALIAEAIYPMAGVRRLSEPALDWVRQYSVLVIFAVTAALILLWQYRDRATIFSRAVGIGGAALAIAAFLWLPSSFLFGVQSLLPRRSAAARPVQVSIDPGVKGNGTWYSGGRDPIYRRIRVPLPIAVRGLPEGVEARGDALSVSFEWAGNQSWKPDLPPGLNPRTDAPGVSVSDATVLMDSAMYWRNRNYPLTLTGAVYLTLFGDAETRKVALRDRPVNLQDGLQCFVGDFDHVLCRSFFRWPARLVYAESGDSRFTFEDSLISYSPFPANPGLNPMETRLGGELTKPELTVTTRRPLAHFWQKFEASGLSLADFEGAAPPIPPRPGTK